VATACAMRAALGGLVSLLEGTTGATECHIDAGQFSRVDPRVETLEVSPAARPYPFNVRRPRLVSGSEEMGDLTSGSMMRGAHAVEVRIAYPAQPHDDLELLCDILDDETAIRAALEYEPNIDLTADWCGCLVVGSEVEDILDENEQPVLRVLVLEVELRTHDERTT